MLLFWFEKMFKNRFHYYQSTDLFKLAKKSCFTNDFRYFYKIYTKTIFIRFSGKPYSSSFVLGFFWFLFYRYSYVTWPFHSITSVTLPFPLQPLLPFPFSFPYGNKNVVVASGLPKKRNPEHSDKIISIFKRNVLFLP